MAGLDNINNESTEQQGEAQVTPQATFAAPKNAKFALPAIKGTAPVDASILEQMQQIIAEKEAKKASFGESMRDLMAYDVGYGGNLNKSLAERSAQRESNTADIFNMKSQIAQYKAAQQQLQKQANLLRGAADGQALPSTGAAATSPIAVPASVRQEIKNRLDAGDVPGAQKVYDDWFKTETTETIKMETSPSAYEKKVEMEDAEGNIIYVDALEARRMRNAGVAKPTGREVSQPPTGGLTTGNIATVESGGNASAVSPKGARGVMQVMPNTQRDPGFGVTPAKDDSPAELQRVGEEYFGAMQKRYGNDTLAAIAYNMGPGKTDEWLASGADFNKLPKETQDYIGKVYVANAAESRKPQAAKPAAQPVASTGAVSEAARSRAAAEKAGGEEFAKGVGKELAGTVSAIDKAGQTAGDDYVRASEIVKIASDPTMKEMFGVLEKGGVAPAVLRQMQDAVNAGQFGTFGLKNLADNLAKAGANPDQIAKYDRMVRNLATAELKWAQTYLKGQGAVSDAERELIRKAVGSASGNPAQVLVMQGQIMQERARFDAAMSKAYDEYRNKYGSYADPAKFMRTMGKPIMQQHTRDLAKILGVDPSEIAGIDPYKKGAGPSTETKEETPKPSGSGVTSGGIKYKVIKPKS